MVMTTVIFLYGFAISFYVSLWKVEIFLVFSRYSGTRPVYSSVPQWNSRRLVPYYSQLHERCRGDSPSNLLVNFRLPLVSLLSFLPSCNVLYIEMTIWLV
jgi:hypothetical protein